MNAELHVLAGASGFLLGVCRKNCEHEFALHAYAVDSLLEVDVHHEPLELPDGGQERHSVPRKSGDGFRQDEVKLPGPGVRHHPLQSHPLLLRAGEDFVRVDPRVFSCWLA